MSRCSVSADRFASSCTMKAARTIKACKENGKRRRRVCTEKAEESYRKCDREEEESYKDCARKEEKCSDWLPWPLDYLCDAFELVCVAWTWVTHKVCKAWVWATKQVCKAWSYVVEGACHLGGWLAEGFCKVVSWFFKVLCAGFDFVRCLLVAVSWGLGRLLFGWTKKSHKIKHVFVLMLENRSFDHMFGESGLRGPDSESGQPTVANDLSGGPFTNIDPPDLLQPAVGTVVEAKSPAAFALTSAEGGPGHEFYDAVEQLCGVYVQYTPGQPFPDINNSGFVANGRRRGNGAPEKAMQVFHPRQLPVLNTLAREFAVCDDWYSSLPGPTWPNRMFVHAASSAGLDDSPSSLEMVVTSAIDGYRFDNGTIFDRLDDKCLKWLVYEGDETPHVFALSGMTINALKGRFHDMKDFSPDLADKSFPASYVFIEPDYGNIMPWTDQDYTCGTSQHPLDDVTRGEKLIKDVYEAIRNSPVWDKSLLIITYDEHGGFYDHVRPPTTVHPGDSVTDDENVHIGFDFTQLGARVPAVVVSPYIQKGVIDHKRHDHSAVIKTVCEIFNLPPLTQRDRWTESLTHLLTLRRPRTDAPTTLPDPAPSGLQCTGGIWDGGPIYRRAPADGVADLTAAEVEMTTKLLSDRPPEPGILGFFGVALSRYLSLTPVAERDDLVERARTVRSSLEARNLIVEARKAVRAFKAKGAAAARPSPQATVDSRGAG